MTINEIIAGMTNAAGNKKIAVAAAEDSAVITAVRDAITLNLASFYLFGDEKKIRAITDELRVNPNGFSIIHTNSTAESAVQAVEYVRTGKADILMKGLLQTAELLRAVLDKERGIRGKGLLSHVGIMHAGIMGRPILITDAAMVVAPDLKTKVDLVKNAVRVAHGLGISVPKVVPLAAVELVNPDMQATLDAAALTVMGKRGQITGCDIDGPYAFDLAISQEAVKHKKIESEVAGNADILLFHTIEAANSTLKSFVFIGEALFGGLLIGATAPVVMNSRSDSDHAKLYSIACATSMQ